MNELLTTVNIQVKDCLYIKDPETSELGKRIIAGSIDLIEDIGFDDFTFRKLAESIGSTEASIYRYFENKNRVLLYLTSWYWAWMEYRLVFHIANIDSAAKRLEKALSLITTEVQTDQIFSHIDEGKLHRIVVSESMKAYLNKEVDTENKEGAFLQYKQFVGRLSNIILEIAPNYKYPHMLISTVIEGAHLQKHFADHLPRLTDIIKGENSIAKFYSDIVFNAIDKSK